MTTYEHQVHRSKATASKTFRLFPVLVGVLLAVVLVTAVAVPVLHAFRANASVLVGD